MSTGKLLLCVLCILTLCVYPCMFFVLLRLVLHVSMCRSFISSRCMLYITAHYASYHFNIVSVRLSHSIKRLLAYLRLSSLHVSPVSFVR